MDEIKKLCMSCMLELDRRESVCPYCGYAVNSKQEASYIPLGTLLNERYHVGKMIKRNVDSAVYIGYDETIKKAVEIREFFPEKISFRDDDMLTVLPAGEYSDTFDEYLKSYVQLWKNLMRFKGLPALFDVTDVFELNSTAYAVTDHNDSTTFRKILDTMDVEKNPFSTARTKTLITSILSTVESLHTANVVHRGISPETLVLSSDGTLKLTGFAISQVRTTKNKMLNSVCDGYAAIEQYDFNWQQGSWTDIYSIGAVIYKMLTGRTLPPAPERLNNEEIYFTQDELKRIPDELVKLMKGCLVLMPQGRIKDIHDIVNAFSPDTASKKTVIAIKGSVVPRDKDDAKGKKVSAAQVITPSNTVTAGAKKLIEKNEIRSEPQEIVKPKQAIAVTQTVLRKPPASSDEVQSRAALMLEKLRRVRESGEERDAVKQSRSPEKKKEKPEKPKKEKKYRLKPVQLAVLIGCAVCMFCFLTTFLLYGTLLYRYFDVPVLDNCLMSVSFLPINKRDEFVIDNVEYVKMADFYMMTREYIENDSLYRKRYRIVFEYEYSDTVAMGYVCGQSISSGTNVPKGSTITVYISKGIEYIKFIDVSGMQFEEAEKRLTELGFTVNRSEVYNIGIYTQGKVISSTLEVGVEYPRGTEVTLSVWSAPPIILPSTPPTQPGEQPNKNFFSFIRDLFGF